VSISLAPPIEAGNDPINVPTGGNLNWRDQ
jgi:hypothetical protein